MNKEIWRKILEQEKAFLDSLDLKSYLEQEKPIFDIMDQIQKEHGDEYEKEEYIFENISDDDFSHYLKERYGTIVYEFSELRVLYAGS